MGTHHDPVVRPSLSFGFDALGSVLNLFGHVKCLDPQNLDCDRIVLKRPFDMDFSSLLPLRSSLCRYQSLI